MSVLNEDQWLGAPDTVSSYQIQRSLRFNSSDSAYLSRTLTTPTANTRWTWSGWVKRQATPAVADVLFSANFSAGNDARISFDSGNTFLYTDGGGSGGSLQTTAVYRDFSAWQHVVFVYDSPNATSSDRLQLYLNGVRITASNGLGSTTYPAQNAASSFNAAKLHTIGQFATVAGYYLNGYLADIYFIDGQALTPSSFGQTDANGEWQPIAYTGTYGTNGFKLNFADNSAATAAALGKDTSGNGNNWTPNNLSVTAGAGNDSLVDTPTSYGTDTGVGGEVRGNYATLNAIAGTGTLANGNLEITSSGAAGRVSTIGLRSGKWYWETTIGSTPVNTYVGLYEDPNSYSTGYAVNGTGGRLSTTGGTYAVTDGTFQTGDVFGIATDIDAGTITWFRNGSTAVTLTGATLNTKTWYPGVNYNAAASTPAVFNFGQRPFAYTAPSGFKALCDTNLTAGTITTSGSFTGNANADGPFIWLNGVPVAMSINGNSVTFGTHADKLANGFKLRTNSVSYNLSGTNNFSVTATGDKFKFARAQANP